MNYKSPYIFLIIATMFWGGNFVIGRGFNETLPPFTLAFVRWLIAFLCFLPFGWNELVKHIQLWKKDWKIIVFMSLTGIACFNTFVYIAVHYTTSINATIVNSTAPAFITLFSYWFLKDQLSVKHITGILLSIFGVLWIISDGSFSKLFSFEINKGELWMIAAVIVWSTYSIIVKKHAHKYPTNGLFLITMLIGVIFLVPFSIFEWVNQIPMDWSLNTWFGLLYLGIGASIISFLSWNKAVAEIGPSKASPFLNLIPLFAAIFAITFLKEKLMWPQIIGGIIIITGVLMTTGVFKFTSKRKSQ